MSTATIPRTRSKDQILAWAHRQKSAPLSAAQAAAMDSVYPEWRKTRNGAWFTKLEGVASFVASTGSFPRSNTKDEEEASLGIWLSTQRFRADKLSRDRSKVLDDRLPGWREPGLKSWEDRLEETSRIVAQMGRLPKSTDTGGSLSAYGWLRKHLNCPPHDPRRNVLDTRFPGWDKTRDGLWERKLALVVEYFAANGRLPSQYEKTCGSWLSVQKRRVSAERRAELDRLVPGWDKSPEDKWTDALDYVARYFTKHRRLPSSESQDPVIRYHGHWVAGQRKRCEPGRAARLDAAIPGWNNGRNLDQLWQRRLEDCSAFLVDNGRLPRGGKTASTAELKLVQWIDGQRRLASPVRQAILDDRLPGWRERKRTVRLTELSAHMV